MRRITRITLIGVGLLMAASLGTAQNGAFSLVDESCGGGLGALTARIESPGHTSAETICYLDEDESGDFTPAGDSLVFVNHDNELTGCSACPGFVTTAGSR